MFEMFIGKNNTAHKTKSIKDINWRALNLDTAKEDAITYN